MVIELLLELGEAAANVVKVLGVGGRERVIERVELEENVKGTITLGLAEAGGIIRSEKVDEIVERGIESADEKEAAMEDKAKMGGVLTVVEVGRDEAGDGIGFDATEGCFHALPVGLKHPLQQKNSAILILRVLINLVYVVVSNGGPYLIVRV